MRKVTTGEKRVQSLIHQFFIRLGKSEAPDLDRSVLFILTVLSDM